MHKNTKRVQIYKKFQSIRMIGLLIKEYNEMVEIDQTELWKQKLDFEHLIYSVSSI